MSFLFFFLSSSLYVLASHFLCSLSLFISFPARAQNNILTTEIGLSSALAANTNGMAWLSVWNHTSTSIWTAQSAVHRIRMRELVSTVASTGTHTLSYHMNIHAHERVTLINNKTHTHTRVRTQHTSYIWVRIVSMYVWNERVFVRQFNVTWWEAAQRRTFALWNTKIAFFIVVVVFSFCSRFTISEYCLFKRFTSISILTL